MEISKIDHSTIEIVSVEKLEKGIVRTMIRIQGKLFKRLHDKFSKEVSWTDEELTFNDCLAMTKEQEKDLEGIFKAYIILLNNGDNLQL